MVIENIFPLFILNAIPANDTEAARRICEHAAGGILSAPLTRLTGAIFKDLNQLKKALIECKFNIFNESVVIKSGPCITVLLKVVHSSQTKYDLVATQYPNHLQIHNVKMVLAPNETAEDVATFKAALNGEPDEETE
jgi:hypothetical protein